MPLRTEPRLTDTDALYEALVQAHRNLDAVASRRLDARLVLLLANHIGDMAVLREAIALASAIPDGRADSDLRAQAPSGHRPVTPSAGKEKR
jgi:hypothetical protein